MDGGTVLYSQQFPLEDIPDFSNSHLSEQEAEQFENWFERQREALKNLVYTPIPGKKEAGELFVSLAKDMSRRYRISMDIIQFPDDIEVSLSTNCCVFSEELLCQLVRLLSMCDQVVTYCPGDNSLEHTLILQFHTHEAKMP